MITKKIGIENELFVMKGEVPVINPVGDTDAFPLLAEIRAEPGRNSQETYLNWIKEIKLLEYKLAEYPKHSLNYTGEVNITPEVYDKAIKKMTADHEKVVASNIYGTKHYTNMKTTENGEIVHYTIYSGLHIHFSYVHEISTYVEPDYIYEPTHLRLSETIGESKREFYLNLYEQLPNPKRGKTKTHSVSILSDWLIKTIVKELDDLLFTKYVGEVRNKYRQPGFYEVKEDGRFEYRSLPFNQDIYNNMGSIIQECWDIFSKI